MERPAVRAWVSAGDDGDPSPHGANTWFYGDQSPRIEVYGATLANAGGSPAIRDELARMLFVAELAEVFMHAAPTNWNPGNSGCEALSRVAGPSCTRPATTAPRARRTTGPTPPPGCSCPGAAATPSPTA